MQSTSFDQKDVARRDRMDESMGFYRFTDGPDKLGWLVNINETILYDSLYPKGRSAVDLYFIEEDGSSFKGTILYEPYFFIICKEGKEPQVEDYIRRNMQNHVVSIETCYKEDLSMNNHLSGKKRKLLKLVFATTMELNIVKRQLLIFVNKNKEIHDITQAYEDVYNAPNYDDMEMAIKWYSMILSYSVKDTLNFIMDLREHDISLYVRAAIDTDIRVGQWYEIKANKGSMSLKKRNDIIKRAEPVILAYDIETTKSPLKFPVAEVDQIMMISYMVDGQGFLITNREIIAHDINDFEYTPKPSFEGPFTIFNEPDELRLIQRFFNHIKQLRPNIFVSYNGDFFDWPFVDTRSRIHGISMEEAVTVTKLGYNPIEVDPEDMLRYARENPQALAQYSVSDAVATYYLYMEYVHPFIFSLCNIIPMNPDDVLRRGSGTLCETLLMVESFKANVIMPNKHIDKTFKTFEGHLIDTETYIGGHVEALQAGIFRSDFPIKFNLVPSAFEKLESEIDQALKFSIEVEGKLSISDVTNLDQVKQTIVEMLQTLRNEPNCLRTPLIYHLDVSAMYPNIILTNRLQPDAMVDESICASCDFNEGPESSCQRSLEWLWRGEHFTAQKGEVSMIRNTMNSENIGDLKEEDEIIMFKKRVSEYSRKAYGKAHETKILEKTSVVCQRENPFYINTVRNFRDRRYEYKSLHKVWKKKLEEALADSDLAKADESRKMIIVFDSLQLAHKCILNSFYGYVMRKAARWYSMEMAGIVCYTGSKIIQLARKIVDQIGQPLELDTDGIWCVLPKGFPENFDLKLKNGKVYPISYPCIMLNHLVHAEFTNHQYQDRKEPSSNEFIMRSENSIFFEVDGPYKAMILPASKEKDKLLKKRYAVFDRNNKMVELKGFEMKRRGELKLIKQFQTDIFKLFLEGSTLQECYSIVASTSNEWLDLIFSKGAEVSDKELFELISENKSMSKSLEEYGAQKSTSISTAKRLAEFLGEAMVQEKGLNCKYVISAKPLGSPVSERAIPLAIFQADPNVQKHYLRKWTKDSGMINFDIRELIDWGYYLERFGSVLQKLITIPAAMQDIENPIPRIPHPDWLQKKIKEKLTTHNQPKIGQIFKSISTEEYFAQQNAMALASKKADLEDMSSDEEPQETIEATHALNDYSEFVLSRKQKWREIQNNLKTKKVTSRSNTGLFKSSVQSSESEWQIIHVTESLIPGEFHLWVLIVNKLRHFRLNVPRKIYIDFSTNQPLQIDSKLNKVTRSTHTNSNPVEMTELTMQESVYLQNKSLFSNLLNDSAINGIYESEIPLLFKLLCQIKSICSLKNTNNIKGGADPVLDLDNLNFEGFKHNNYLKDTNLEFVYLFHTTSGQRHLFSLFIIGENRIENWFVDPGKNMDNLPNVSKFYSEQLERYYENESTSDGLFTYPETITFTNHVERQEETALKEIKKFIRNSKTMMNSIFIIQAPTLNKIIRETNLNQDHPFLYIKGHFKDSEFPALLWQTHVCKLMMTHCFNLSQWAGEKLMIARYANLPLCNIESDYAIHLTDIFLARKLEKSNVLLWINESNKMASFSNYQIIDNRGFYSNISLELDVKHLAFNSIIHSTLIGELEGLSDGFSGSSNITGSSQVFNSAKQLVKQWWVECVETDHLLPEILLDNFYRWMTSTHSTLHDPIITHSIEKMMEKVFVQLVSELQKLGSEIVYASFEKIVIHTTKTSMKRAAAYGAYILEAISKKPLFQLLSITISNLKAQMLWLDNKNKSGHVVKIDQILQDDNGVELLLEWNISNYLPPVLRNLFSNKLGSFQDLLNRVYSDQDISISEKTQIISQFIRQDLKRSLLNDVPMLYREWNRSQTQPNESFIIPNLPGSQFLIEDPVLEFVKYLIEAMRLYKPCSTDVRILRRDLLNVLTIKEFDPKAEFQSPSVSVIIKRLICEYCSSTHDLDLVMQSQKALSCSTCRSEYDIYEIEDCLLDMTRHALLKWQQQDLICSHCKLVSQFNMKEHCVCSRNLTTYLDKEVYEQLFKIYQHIAEYYEMRLLSELTGWINYPQNGIIE